MTAWSGGHTQNATGIADASIPFSTSESTSPPRKTRKKTRSSGEWSNSRAYLEGLGSLDPCTQAALMLERYPDHPPDAFYDSGRKRQAAAKRALETWAPRLLSCAPNLGFYSLHWYHLPDLCEPDADPRKLYNPETLTRWIKALKKALRGNACRWKLEVGDEGRLHLHVIADLDALLPEIPRGGEVVKKVYDLGGLAEYLSKPAAPYTIENLATYIEAGQTGTRRPNLSNTLNCPDKRTYKPPSRLILVPSVFMMGSRESLEVTQEVLEVPVTLENPKGLPKKKDQILASSEQCVSTVSTGARVLCPENQDATAFVAQIARTIQPETNSERPAPPCAPRPRKPSYVRLFKNAWACLTYGPDANHTALTAREHIVITNIFKVFGPVSHPALATYPEWLQRNWGALKQLERGLDFDRHEKPPHALLALHFTMKYLPYIEKGNDLKIAFGEVYPTPREREQRVDPRMQAALNELFSADDL